MCFVVAYAHSGLSPVRARPWRANKKNPETNVPGSSEATAGIEPAIEVLQTFALPLG